MFIALILPSNTRSISHENRDYVIVWIVKQNKRMKNRCKNVGKRKEKNLRSQSICCLNRWNECLMSIYYLFYARCAHRQTDDFCSISIWTKLNRFGDDGAGGQASNSFTPLFFLITHRNNMRSGGNFHLF